MLTILLEVKSNHVKRVNFDFYNPATHEFKKFPRTENGIQKAIKELIKVAQKYDWIEDYRFVVYDGKYENYKNMKPDFIIDSRGEMIQR